MTRVKLPRNLLRVVVSGETTMRKVASKSWNEKVEPSVRPRNYLRILLAAIGALAVAACNNTSLLTEVKAEVTQAKNPLTLAVIYDPNGATSGSVPSDSKTYAQGATVTVPGCRHPRQNGLCLCGLEYAGERRRHHLSARPNVFHGNVKCHSLRRLDSAAQIYSDLQRQR